MLNSMTGYGSVTVSVEYGEAVIEIKTVNHRFLDIVVNADRSLQMIESQIKPIIKKFFNRGRVELFIHIDQQLIKTQALKPNWAMLDQYNQFINDLSSHYADNANQLISKLPDFDHTFSIKEADQINEPIIASILAAVETACVQVNEMRKIEGSKLTLELKDRFNQIDNLINQMTQLRGQVKEQHFLRMKERMELLLSTQGLDYTDRFYHELAILAEKGDITEELVRIDSHLSQSRGLLAQAGVVGRKLDFIVQELMREANTIGSKANDSRISEYVIELKSALEKIKEQVQNIE
ncbi:TIGR00255 family protein [Amphibacillus marinus]|uniref:TIGR00255 family protein n=1 Tax=Amphibacillus marinus TaxID=872970 RepID=A0A1H8I038_9BACI|nr:YicC/YloC family endoribonuclease [Amphibacillus marinus]SEN61515.1 TIGR00255 family protein [Amphibacillus marinus]